MTMINALELTVAAVIMTLTGEAPLEIWLPLFEDIITGLLGVLM